MVVPETNTPLAFTMSPVAVAADPPEPVAASEPCPVEEGFATGAPGMESAVPDAPAAAPEAAPEAFDAPPATTVPELAEPELPLEPPPLLPFELPLPLLVPLPSLLPLL